MSSVVLDASAVLALLRVSSGVTKVRCRLNAIGIPVIVGDPHHAR